MAGALASVLEWPEPGRAGLVAEVVVACARLAAGSAAVLRPVLAGSEVGRYADACAAAVRVAADHPGDLGIVALLLMRHEVLQPGQAVFMPAGGLHAYLRGTGIELLANSDNVVRAGLTGKHIDVPELLKLLDPAVSVPVLSPRVLPDGIAWFDTPAPEFRLYLLDLAGPRLPCPAPARGSCCASKALARCAPRPARRSSWPAAILASSPPSTPWSTPLAPPACLRPRSPSPRPAIAPSPPPTRSVVIWLSPLRSWLPGRPQRE